MIVIQTYDCDKDLMPWQSGHTKLGLLQPKDVGADRRSFTLINNTTAPFLPAATATRPNLALSPTIVSSFTKLSLFSRIISPVHIISITVMGVLKNQTSSSLIIADPRVSRSKDPDRLTDVSARHTRKPLMPQSLFLYLLKDGLWGRHKNQRSSHRYAK